jgi:hypothetical protein
MTSWPGVISAGRRLEARAAWTGLAATAEFAARHPAPAPSPPPAG